MSKSGVEPLHKMKKKVTLRCCDLSIDSVKIAIEDCKSLSNKKERETTKILAMRQPAWNETLRFLVGKEDWKEREKLFLGMMLTFIYIHFNTLAFYKNYTLYMN